MSAVGVQEKSQMTKGPLGLLTSAGGFSNLWLSLLVVFGLVGSVAIAQLMTRSEVRRELNCATLRPIQSKFYEKHIVHSAESKQIRDRAVEQFVKRLDPIRLYLTEPDAKEIEKLMGNLSEQLSRRNCEAIKKAHQLYSRRVAERAKYAETYLGSKFKFDPKTEILLDGEKRGRAKTPAAARAFHEKYMQYQVSIHLATGTELEEAKAQVVRNYERIQRRVEGTSEEDLFSMFLDAYARALDPHSSYLSQSALEDFEIQMRLSLEGIGATLSSQDGFTVIEQLIPGGAAFESGSLRPKDKIVAVGQGEKEDFVNVIEMDLRDVVRMIRGPKGSKVRLMILRKTGETTERFPVTLVRDQIRLEDDAAAITYHERQEGDKKLQVALINLPSFYADNRRNGRSSARDVQRLLSEARKKGVDAVVLDLSNNGGGSLRDAVDISGLFIGRANVVKQSMRTTSEGAIHHEVLRANDERVTYPGPLVILNSRVSASASEIVSGTLQDYKRAVVVGADHTFGKGSVQSVEYLPAGLGAIKTTVGMFFTPGGNSTQHQGVVSDIVLDGLYAGADVGEKTLDHSLPPQKIRPFLSPEAYVTEGPDAWLQLEKSVVERLKKQSQERVAKSEEFKKLRETLAKNEGRRGRTVVVGDILSERQKAKEGEESPEDEEESLIGLSREERQKRYLERADVQEAITIAADLARELSRVNITLGEKSKVRPATGTATP